MELALGPVSSTFFASFRGSTPLFSSSTTDQLGNPLLLRHSLIEVIDLLFHVNSLVAACSEYCHGNQKFFHFYTLLLRDRGMFRVMRVQR
jgi:hypothetical protein